MQGYLRAVKERVPLVVGRSAPAMRVAIARAREARETGAIAITVAPPNSVKNLDLTDIVVIREQRL